MDTVREPRRPNRLRHSWGFRERLGGLETTALDCTLFEGRHRLVVERVSYRRKRLSGIASHSVDDEIVAPDLALADPREVVDVGVTEAAADRFGDLLASGRPDEFRENLREHVLEDGRSLTLRPQSFDGLFVASPFRHVLEIDRDALVSGCDRDIEPPFQIGVVLLKRGLRNRITFKRGQKRILDGTGENLR